MKKMINAAFILALTSVSAMAMMQDGEKDNKLGLTQARRLLNQIQGNPVQPEMPGMMAPAPQTINFTMIVETIQSLRTRQSNYQNAIDGLLAIEQPVLMNDQLNSNTLRMDRDYIAQTLLNPLENFFGPNHAYVLNNMPGAGAAGLPHMHPAPVMPAHMMPAGMPGMGNPMDYINPDQRSLLNLVESAKALSTPGMEINVTFNFKK